MTSIAGEEGTEIDHATSISMMISAATATATATAKDDTNEIDLHNKYCVDSMAKDGTDDDSDALQDVAALPPMDPQERDETESANNIQPNKNRGTKRKLGLAFVLIAAIVAIAVGVRKNREGSATTVTSASSALNFNPETDCADVQASFGTFPTYFPTMSDSNAAAAKNEDFDSIEILSREDDGLPTIDADYEDEGQAEDQEMTTFIPTSYPSASESPNKAYYSNDFDTVDGWMDRDRYGERRSLTSMSGSTQKQMLIKEKKMVRRKLNQALTEEARVSTRLIFLLCTFVFIHGAFLLKFLLFFLSTSPETKMC